jgi:sterol desaturase/sphingolipid hydroxylase (fatty acid hydroxylase superfamily)
VSPLLSDQSRLLALIIGATILWCVESLGPLYGYDKHRLRRAFRNIALTALLVVSNLALSVITAAVANFATNERLGLFFLFALPSWLTILFGIMVLDLFTYFAHVSMHKTSLGWRFHRVHHSDNEVNVTTAFANIRARLSGGFCGTSSRLRRLVFHRGLLSSTSSFRP